MKIVLDTNVLIAAFIAKGTCHILVERCLQIHSVITSDFILDEFQEKLTQNFNFSNKDFDAVEKPMRLHKITMEGD